jgi:hypothetical protein
MSRMKGDMGLVMEWLMYLMIWLTCACVPTPSFIPMSFPLLEQICHPIHEDVCMHMTS